MNSIQNIDLKAELKKCAAAVKANPKSSEPYLQRGATYLKLKDDFKALNDFDKAIEYSPNDAEGYFHRGLAHMMGLNHVRAASDFTKAMELNQADDRYLYHRALAYKEHDDWKLGISDFQAYSSNNRLSVDGLCEYGYCLAKAGEAERAEDCFTKALEQDPSYPKAHYYLGIKYFDEEKFSLSEAALRKAFTFYTKIGDRESASLMSSLVLSMEGKSAKEARVRQFGRLSLSEQLSVFGSCGIEIPPAVPLEIFGDPERYSTDPFVELLSTLSVAEWEGQKVCRQIQSFPFKGIEVDGDYIEILRQIRDVCGTHLPLTDLDDSVDLGDDLQPRRKPKAEISFKLDNRSYSYKLKVDYKYLDESIFAKVGKLLSKRTNGEFKIWYSKFSPEFIMLGLATKHIRTLEQKTTLKFLPLE